MSNVQTAFPNAPTLKELRGPLKNGVFVRSESCGTSPIWYKYDVRQHEWFWTPERSLSFWMPVSTIEVSQGEWKGQVPAIPNVRIIEFLNMHNPDPAKSDHFFEDGTPTTPITPVSPQQEMFKKIAFSRFCGNDLVDEDHGGKEKSLQILQELEQDERFGEYPEVRKEVFTDLFILYRKRGDEENAKRCEKKLIESINDLENISDSDRAYLLYHCSQEGMTDLERYEQAFSLIKESEDYRDQRIAAAIANSIGWHHFNLGHSHKESLTKATNAFKFSLETARKIESTESMIGAMCGLAICLTYRGAFETSSNYFKKAISICKDQRNIEDSAFAHWWLGHCYERWVWSLANKNGDSISESALRRLIELVDEGILHAKESVRMYQSMKLKKQVVVDLLIDLWKLRESVLFHGVRGMIQNTSLKDYVILKQIGGIYNSSSPSLSTVGGVGDDDAEAHFMKSIQQSRHGCESIVYAAKLKNSWLDFEFALKVILNYHSEHTSEILQYIVQNECVQMSFEGVENTDNVLLTEWHWFIDSFFDDGLLYTKEKTAIFVYPRMKHDLARLIKYEKVPLLRFLNMATSLLSGLSSLQKAHIVHRDIKPHNILVTEKDTVVIADFGCHKKFSGKEDPPFLDKVRGEDLGVVGTPYYLAPELSSREYLIHSEEGVFVNYSKSDVFSMGIVLYGLLKAPMGSKTINPFGEVEDPSKRSDDNYVELPHSTVPSDVRKVVRAMLLVDPRNRMSTKEALKRFREIKSVEEMRKQALERQYFFNCASKRDWK